MAKVLAAYCQSERHLAEQHAANARVQEPGIRFEVKYVKGGVMQCQSGGTSLNAWQVLRLGPYGAGSGGGGSAGPSPAPAAPALPPQLTGPAASQLGLPGYAGPSPFRFRTGAANQQAVIPPRMGNYFGLDTFNPSTKIGLEYTPDALNIDDIEKLGSRCSRRGLAKLDTHIGTVTLPTVESANLTAIANTSLTASTDHFTLTDPAADTHAFWFDTTGADSEPAGSVAADFSYRVITTGLTDEQVAVKIRNMVNASPLELLATIESGTPTQVDLESFGGAGYVISKTVTDAGFTITAFSSSGGGTISADARGLSITRVPATEDGGDQLVLAYADEDAVIGADSSGLVPVSLHLVTADPCWGKPLNMDGQPGPDITVSQTAMKIRVVSDYDLVLPDQVGQVRNSIRQIIVRYSVTAYPADPDAHDCDCEELVSRDAWDGDSRTDDSITVVAGTYYISAWAVGVEGISRASRQRVVIS